ncbi:MAG: rRNA pseudouridine synthase [Candidatus Solibacter sp.]|nr:rRNA pseudouridine synthase [Candidatus Solibacter sp.]
MERPKQGSKERWRKTKAVSSDRAEVRGAAATPAAKTVLKTLDRVISKAGVASRTLAQRWIAQGRVKVNGKTVKDAEQWVDLKKDKVLLDGKPLEPKEKVYLLLYKPKGYLTTRTDPDGRPTIYDLLTGMKEWVFPVGRLDQDTSGLLILTNDSALAEQLTNPEYHVPKTYMVKTAHLLSDEQIEALRRGVELKDGPTRPAEVKRLRDSGQRTFLEITITEGRNRQVRRMVEEIGSKVLKLVRVSIGELRIGGLQIGHVRALEAGELKALRRAGRKVGMQEAGASDGG